MIALNSVQQKVVDHLHGPILVMAGAGSGKSTVVTCRIAQMLAKGIDASEILALTFTNKAVGVMREKLLKMSGTLPLISTFHSLGVLLLREYLPDIGGNPQFGIYDARERANLLKYCAESLGLKESAVQLKGMGEQISKWKNNMIPFEDDGTELSALARMYENKLHEYNAVDFDDLLYLSVKIFRESPRASTIAKRWNFLLIDEYQDTNAAQYAMVKFLAQQGNLCAVGDPDQSIYAWRGANMSNILNFEKDFPHATVVTLSENYRSSNLILEIANNLIENNSRKHKKQLWSSLGKGNPPSVFKLDNESEESEFVVSKVAQLLCQNNIGDIAILYRTNAQSRHFEDRLLSKNIPYIVIGGMSFYKRKEINDLLSFLRLIAFPADFVSFSRIVNIPRRGIGKITVNSLGKESLAIMESAALAAKGLSEIKLSTKQRNGLATLCTITNNAVERLNNGSTIHNVLRQLIDETGYIDHLKLDKDFFDDRISNVQELLLKAMEWNDNPGMQGLLSFLDNISLGGDEVIIEPRVKLMTTHNAKGMEFDACFLVGMEEGLFPYLFHKDGANIEEERRLCYVGITRSKQVLYLTMANSRSIWGSIRANKPSRFLKEMKITKGALEQSGEIIKGNKVVHNTFGQGVVKKVYTTSLGLAYDVYFFDLQKEHSLIAKYANLTLSTLQ